LGETEEYININGYLYGVITMKVPPEATAPGIIRELLTCGFPLTISTHVVIPNQQKVISQYKSRYKKMQAAQTDKDGGHKVDVNAEVQSRELLEIQERLISGSCKTTQTSFSITFRTSRPATTASEYELAERELANCRQQLLQVIARRNGANALAETLSKRRLFLGSLPGMAVSDRRDMDLLTEHAADLVPVEVPWNGMQREPLTVWHTPYRSLLPFSPFDASLENANALICANSGSGKSVLILKLLLTCSRRDTKVSILEKGDSYKTAVELMGGDMLKMSLDSDFAINPFDIPDGMTTPSKDQMAFLKTLTRFMVGDGGGYDVDILDGILDAAIKATYDRIAARRSGSTTPLFSDLREELQTFSQRGQPGIEELAKIAAFKLGSWVGQGMYANLFDRHTTVPMNSPWLYFNIEQLKDDPRLETAMSLLIAYATTNRASGEGGQRSIVILDECWSLLDSKELAKVVEQLFRTARKRNACVWGVSQSVADFTGTVDNPKPIGAAILATTSTRFIGRQKGNLEVLQHYLHFGPVVCNAVANIGMTEKGKQSQFVLAVGDSSETTMTVYVRITGFEYWAATTMPRERTFREYWYRLHPNDSIFDRLYSLAEKYPSGISALPELPEEKSGAVYQINPSVFLDSLAQEAHV
jgi:type IV secretory pathway VirB4 component